MRSQDYWQIFLETGAPEMYLLFNRARKTETNYVPDDPGTGITGNELQ